eukprot:3431929-Amphidinium_carterae.1
MCRLLGRILSFDAGGHNAMQDTFDYDQVHSRLSRIIISRRVRPRSSTSIIRCILRAGCVNSYRVWLALSRCLDMFNPRTSSLKLAPSGMLYHTSIGGISGCRCVHTITSTKLLLTKKSGMAS